MRYLSIVSILPAVRFGFDNLIQPNFKKCYLTKNTNYPFKTRKIPVCVKSIFQPLLINENSSVD